MFRSAPRLRAELPLSLGKIMSNSSSPRLRVKTTSLPPLRLPLCLRVFVVSQVLFAAGLCAAGQADGRLDCYWIDVEGGAATLIVTPQGESLLVDTGHPGHHDGDRIVRAVVERAGLRRIDHLVVTHYHIDHFGGAATLAKMLPIGAVYDNGDWPELREPPDEAYKSFVCDRRVQLSAGDTLPLRTAAAADAPSVAVRCLAARQQIINPPADGGVAGPHCEHNDEKPVDNSDNANSIVLRLAFGRFDFFVAGDLTWNVERRLVCPLDLVGPVDVYQATHHGLDASNHPAVVRTLSPTVAVMSNGPTKGCEPRTFATLRETPSIQAIYQVHKNLRDDRQNNTADDCIANQSRECQGQMIELSVDPRGESFTVRVPATGHERTFECR